MLQKNDSFILQIVMGIVSVANLSLQISCFDYAFCIEHAKCRNTRVQVWMFPGQQDEDSNSKKLTSLKAAEMRKTHCVLLAIDSFADLSKRMINSIL